LRVTQLMQLNPSRPARELSLLANLERWLRTWIQEMPEEGS
jgi:hypothetical protein